ncbi:MAG: apolipoprotein N-acyltransferase, partial [Alphaproteobacteria bacterium HGW-Alphaproteobacteria-8]
YGRIRASLALGVRGALDSPLPAPAPRTVFSRLGDAGALALLMSAALLVLAMGGARRPSARA